MGRRYTRKKVEIPCRIVWSDHAYRGVLLDLSLGGAFVEASIIPKTGSDVTIEFDDSDGDLFHILSEVVHGGWYVEMEGKSVQGFGVLFHFVDEVVNLRFRRFLEVSVYGRPSVEPRKKKQSGMR